MVQYIESPLVSVIIPVYNAAPWLEECLESVISQSLADTEIICVNDGSTDQSREILEEYRRKDSRISIIDQENQGLSSSRNAAVRAASGRFLYFVDADDWIEPETLGILANEMLEHDLDLIRLNCFCYADNEQNQPYADKENEHYLHRSIETGKVFTGAELFCKEMKTGSFVSPAWLTMIKRSFFEDQGLWFRPGVIHEDEAYTCIAVLKAERTKYIDETFYHRRFRENSIITSGIDFRNACGMYRASCDIRRALEGMSLPEETQNAVQERIRLLQMLSMESWLQCTPDEKDKYRLLDPAEQEDFHRTIVLPAKQMEQTQEEDRSFRGRIRRRFGSTAPYLFTKKAFYRCVRAAENAVSTAEKVPRDLRRSRIRKTHTVVQLHSRLGNQMFIYAFARKLMSLGTVVEFDDRTMTRSEEPGYNPSLLMNAFGITFPRTDNETIEAFLHTDRIRRHLTGVVHEADDFAYDERFFRRKAGYYTGWFQNPAYFNDIQEEIRDFFRFREISPGLTEALEMKNRILADDGSCAVHMRFGDYLSEGYAGKYQGFCTDAYYISAVRTVQERNQNTPLYLYVFSDEPDRAREWFRKHRDDTGLPEDAVIFVDVCTERDSWIDMYLMSLCRHSIIANSTFSWWGAFLNRNPERIAVTPQAWLRDKGKVYPGVPLDNAVVIGPEGKIIH